jgi:hypothetical protein
MSYRTSAKRIRQWRWMGKKQQSLIIENQEAMKEESILTSEIDTAAAESTPQHMTPEKLHQKMIISL